MTRPGLSSEGSGGQVFLTTRWTMVLRAGGGAEADPEGALSELCRDYWYPLYSFVRRWGHSPHDAQDLTQTFMLHLLESPLLSRASPDKGRFRTYLLSALQNFLRNEHRRGRAVKRGGGVPLLSLDEEEGERRFASEPADAPSPEAQFDRNWAFAVLEKVSDRLREEYVRAGRADLHEALLPYLAGRPGHLGAPAYEEVGQSLGMARNAVGVSVHRMRRRYGELLREEIAQTVGSPEEVELELRHLLSAVAR